jgi:hypothetical protein
VEIVIYQLRQIFGAAMDLGVAMSPTPRARPVCGINCIMPTAPTRLRHSDRVGLRHQQEAVEPVLAGIAPEDLDRVTKALHVRFLGRSMQLLELR